MAAEKSEAANAVSLVQHFFKQDEELSQECQNLITTLPTESDWFSVQIYQYQGFWHMKSLIQGILNCQNHFQAHDSDILIVTPLKCGTTWLKALVFSILNRKNAYNMNPNLDPTRTSIEPHPLLSANPHVLVPNLEFDLYFNTTNPDLSSFQSPRLLSSHLPYVSLPESVKQSRCKIVYLCRNPKDVFVSLWHFMNRLRPEVEELNTMEYLFEKFCRGVTFFGPFWDHVLGYYKESLERPERIMFLKYKELKSEPVRVLKDLGKFIGYTFSEKEENNGDVVGDILRLCSFESLRNLEVNKSGKLDSGVENKAYFRRGEVGDWKNFFTIDMIKQIEAITEDKFGKHGLKF
ncbi:cytosolic sulfotransferase 5-like [Prosopis cineraria]|uniref:cytosolic sulfotransferase 5-like n=1 Tax=Prosopis cineraria TaxID=364024 RepID=UPI0024102AD2|nr:cytosolic sulfotransferase 5-like [Prosopis cineraria]